MTPFLNRQHGAIINIADAVNETGGGNWQKTFEKYHESCTFLHSLTHQAVQCVLVVDFVYNVHCTCMVVFDTMNILSVFVKCFQKILLYFLNCR